MHVVVTGAGTGIGLAIAERLHRDGATLTLLARDLDRLETVAGPLGATALRCDIRDAAPIARVHLKPTRAEHDRHTDAHSRLEHALRRPRRNRSRSHRKPRNSVALPGASDRSPS